MNSNPANQAVTGKNIQFKRLWMSTLSPSEAERRRPPRIIAAHFFGIDEHGQTIPPANLKRNDLTPDDDVTLNDPAFRSCFQRLVVRVHDLGPRAIGELHEKISTDRGNSVRDLLERLETFTQRDPTTIKPLDAQCLPPPLSVVV